MLYKSINRTFSTKNVCILANSRQSDLIGSKVMANLKKVAGSDQINFYGYGGEHMLSEGFKNTYDVPMDKMLDKTFHTFRRSKVGWSEDDNHKFNPFNLVNKHYSRHGDDMFSEMLDQDIPKQIFHSRPNLVLNIGNEYITTLMMEELAKYYSTSQLTMPKRHLFSRFVKDLKEYSLKYVDYCHYTVPLNQAHSNGFVFPSEYIGQYGVYEAVKHIYNSSEKLKGYVQDDFLLTNKRYFASDMESAVQQVRSKFRAANKIDENAHVIFVAPGNEKNEVEFSMENIRKGVKEFLLKYSAPTSLSSKAKMMDGNFVTVLSLHEGSEGEKWVRDYLKTKEWTGRLVIVTEKNNQHFDAMAASDFGLIHDGQMVSSANALNLPCNTMFHMRMYNQYYQRYFNRWWNDMNLIADRDVNLELIGGQFWFGKIADTIAEDFVNPNARSTSIKNMQGFVVDGMSFKPLDRSEVRTKDLLVDGQPMEQYYDPFLLAARNMYTDIQEYDEFAATEFNQDMLRVDIERL